MPNGTADLTSLGATSTSDLTFKAGITYSPTTFTIPNGASLSLGTLNDLDATQSLTIQNGVASTASTLTLGGTSNPVAPSTSDLLYVASGGTLTIQNGTGTLGVTLNASGNLDIVGNASISSIVSMGANAITKTGSGTLTLNAANTGSGGFTIKAGTVSTNNNNGLGSTGNVVNLGVGSDASSATLLLTGTPSGLAQSIVVASGGVRTIQASTTTTSGNGAIAGNAITLNGDLHLAETGGGNMQFRGAITTSNSSNLIIDANNTGEVNFSGVGNSFNNLTVKSGFATVGRASTAVTNAFGTSGAITLGDSSTSNAAGVILETGSTVANAIGLASGATNSSLTIGIGSANMGVAAAGAANGTFSGPISLNGKNLTILDNTISASTTSAGSLTVSGGITGTGNLTINNNSANTSASAGNTGGITLSTNLINNVGTITNSGTASSTAGTVGAVTISAGIGSNVSGITQNSTSKLVLSGTNTAAGGFGATGSSGTVTVSSGTLQMGNAAALGVVNAVTVASAGTFDLNGNNESIAGLNDVSGSGGTVTNTGAAKTLTLGGGGTYSYAGTITATTPANLAVTKTGAGTQTLGGNNSYAGVTTISQGTLKLGSATALGVGTIGSSFTGTLDFNGYAITNTIPDKAMFGATLTNTGAAVDVTGMGTIGASAGRAFNVDGTGDITFGQQFTGNYTVTKNGINTVTLAGTTANALVANVTNGKLLLAKTAAVNAVNGTALTITGGTVQLGGSGGDQVNNSTAVTVTNGTFDLNGRNETAGTLTIGNGTTNGVIQGSGSTYTANSGKTIEAQSGSASVALAGSGVVLNKTTAGTVTLSGANGYTGGTNVTGGQLRVNNASGSGTGSGAISVGDGTNADTGTLGGSGTIGNGVNALTVKKGGTITAGADSATTGTLTSGNQTWQSGGQYAWKLASRTGTAGAVGGWDKLAMATLSVSGLSNTIGGQFIITAMPATAGTLTLLSGDSFQIATYTGTTGTPTADLFALDVSQLLAATTNDDSASNYDLNIGSGSISISYAAAPEPTTALLLGLSGTALLGRRRRHLRAAV